MAEMQLAPNSSTLSDIGNSVPKVIHSTNVLAVATTQYTFFQKLPTEVDLSWTNMNFAGQFTEGTRFDQTGLGLSITPKRAATAASLNSADLASLFCWLEASYLQLTVNGIEWAALSPTSLMGSINTSVTDVSTILTNAISGGSSQPNRWYPMTIPYDSKVAFVWTWFVQDTTVTDSNLAGLRVKLLMNGKYTYRK